MKKRIIFIILFLLLTTGCSCQYNLTINENTYNEEINIIGDSSSEVSYFNQKWEIPTDKEEYGIILDSGDKVDYRSPLYDYKLNGNTLKFTHSFPISKYSKSSAVSACYETFSVNKSNGYILISTSPRTSCFALYPSLNSITVNISVDTSVIKNNADRVNGNTYTWYINRDNANDKSIDLTLVNNQSSNKSNNQIEQNTTTTQAIQVDPTHDYEIYIFCAVLLVIVLIGYFIYTKMKKNSDKIDI